MLRSYIRQAIPTRLPMQARHTATRYTSSKATLPRLPVPDLHQTLQRYLSSIEPFLLEDADHGGAPFDEAYQQRKLWAEDFEKGLGQKCQERLYGMFGVLLVSDTAHRHVPNRTRPGIPAQLARRHHLAEESLP